MKPAPEITTDGYNVWVNTDICIGRFSSLGVDVHADYETQERTGRQCLDCVHDLPFDEIWDRFRASMLKHHGVEVPDNLKPSERRL